MRTSKLGGSLLIAIFSLLVASAAQAQDSGCPEGRVCVSGNRFKPYDPWALDPSGGAGGGDYGGGSTDIGGGSGSGAGQAPVTPSKTQAQREEEKRRCDSTYSNAKSSLDMQTQALYAACTNGEFATVEKYLEKFPVTGVILGWMGWNGPQACISNVAKTYDKQLFDRELDRAQCKANADKP